MCPTLSPGDAPAMSKTDAPIVPRRRRRRCGGPGVRRPQQKKAAAPGDPGPASMSCRWRRAAGIAAARRIIAQAANGACWKRRQVGGRCLTDTATFGVPYDRGARCLHPPETNPVARLAPRPASTSIRRRPASACGSPGASARERDGGHAGGDGARNSAIADAARKADIACTQALPKDLGEWRSTVEFMLGPYFFGKDLSEISTADFARAAERDVQAFCRQGLGARAREACRRFAGPALDAGDAHQLGGRGRRGRDRERNHRRARRHVTASTDVLSAGKFSFTPDLPKRHSTPSSG